MPQPLGDALPGVLGGGSIAVAITYIEVQADIAAGQITIKITHTTEEIVVLSERTAKVLTKLAELERALSALHKVIEENSSIAKELMKGIAHGELEQMKGLHGAA